MKVDKARFISARDYLREINQANFDDLDWSEFGPPAWAKISAEDFKLTGLQNTDYVGMNWDI